MNDEPDGRTIRADDPRLSEWIDGRLAAAEAAIVARSVAASPELTRVVADLRRLKALLAAAPARPAPAGFVADVLTALDAPPRLAPGTAAGSGGGPADSRIDAEWERIELERIAGEIAEAREDAAVAETAAEPRPRWPWMTMLAALAAGLLVAALVNMPPLHSVLVEKDREVAHRGAAHPQEGLSRAVDEFFADADSDGMDEERSPVVNSNAAPLAGVTAANAEDVRRHVAALEQAEEKKDFAEQGRGASRPLGRGEAERDKAAVVTAQEAGPSGADQLASRTGKPGAVKPGEEMLAEDSQGKRATADPGSLAASSVDVRESLRKAGEGKGGDSAAVPGDRAASGMVGGGGGGGGNGIVEQETRSSSTADQRGRSGRVEPLIVEVRGPEGRAEFAALLAARHISVARGDAKDHDRARLERKLRNSIDGRPADSAAKQPALATVERLRRAADDDTSKTEGADAVEKDVVTDSGSAEVLAISGSPAAIDNLLALLASSRQQTDARGRKQAPFERSRDTADSPPPSMPQAAEAQKAGGRDAPRPETAGLERDGQFGAAEPAPAAKSRREESATVTVLVHLVDVGRPAGPAAAAHSTPAAGAAPSAPATGAAPDAPTSGGRNEP